MKLRTIYVSREHRFALGRNAANEEPIFSIPVSNSMVDYEEYYAISEAELDHFLNDEDAAKAFARQCGRRELDERLILKPGTDRGYY